MPLSGLTAEMHELGRFNSFLNDALLSYFHGIPVAFNNQGFRRTASLEEHLHWRSSSQRTFKVLVKTFIENFFKRLEKSIPRVALTPTIAIVSGTHTKRQSWTVWPVDKSSDWTLRSLCVKFVLRVKNWTSTSSVQLTARQPIETLKVSPIFPKISECLEYSSVSIGDCPVDTQRALIALSLLSQCSLIVTNCDSQLLSIFPYLDRPLWATLRDPPWESHCTLQRPSPHALPTQAQERVKIFICWIKLKLANVKVQFYSHYKPVEHVSDRFWIYF